MQSINNEQIAIETVNLKKKIILILSIHKKEVGLYRAGKYILHISNWSENSLDFEFHIKCSVINETF